MINRISFNQTVGYHHRLVLEGAIAHDRKVTVGIRFQGSLGFQPLRDVCLIITTHSGKVSFAERSRKNYGTYWV